MSFAASGSNMAPYLKATTSVVQSLKPVLSQAAVLPKPTVVLNSQFGQDKLCGSTLNVFAPKRGAVDVTTSLFSATKVRYAHSDVRFPDFSAYRRKDVIDNKAQSRESAPSKFQRESSMYELWTYIYTLNYY